MVMVWYLQGQDNFEALHHLKWNWNFDAHISNLQNTVPTSDLKIAVGHIGISIKFRLSVQPEKISWLSASGLSQNNRQEPGAGFNITPHSSLMRIFMYLIFIILQ